MKHGAGSIMLWESFNSFGIGPLKLIYVQGNIKQFAPYIGEIMFLIKVFEHVNDLKHIQNCDGLVRRLKHPCFVLPVPIFRHQL